MVSKSLYDLCLLLCTPYEKLNLLSNIVYNIDASIIEEIYLNKLFKYKWHQKLNSSFENLNFSYNYKILGQNSNLIKIKLDLKKFFIIKNSKSNITSACINEYILIQECLHSSNKIQYLIKKEDNPNLYRYLLITNLSTINNSIFLAKQSSWDYNLASIDSLYEIYTSMVNSVTINQNSRSNLDFNINDACTYAETFALKPNPEYKSYEDLGGDCTNFVSQILYAGGLKQTKIWKPYTNPWIRAQDLYLYLTKQKFATELPNKNSLSRGCLIQFYTPKIGRFFHNGFITYELSNNDFLYCCHSYNKLNYPLSETFPNKYPTLRALKIN